ncbi:MAG: hypothetical protein ACOX2A_00175 [Tepidanaerobacteraceae bacterium]|jgi:hypothetical protein|nr:hypothetical protein [Thermoanaerobacterales bacterium]
MTKDDLKRAINELDRRKSVLEEELREIELASNSDPFTQSMLDAKNMVRQSIISGNLKNVLEKISNNIDYAKIAVISLSDITQKAQDKLSGKVEEITIASGESIMSNMWFPMVLGLIQTQEFQHLVANTIAGVLKDR